MPTQVRVFLTSGTTWTVPNDFNSLSNTIECVGGGAGGDILGGGGGGGAYALISNLALLIGASITIQIGAGGSPGNAGTDTYFNGSSLAAASVGAKAGQAPVGAAGGAGGTAASSVGTTKYSGGTGGSLANANPGGGGGAAGLNGAGNNGGNGGVAGGGAGGSGDNGSGGAGGAGSAVNGSTGGAGDEWNGKGSGGGGGGGSTNGGTGGLYGGGGGSGLVGGAAGVSGLIVITYASTNPGFVLFGSLGQFALGDSSPNGPANVSQDSFSPVWVEPVRQKRHPQLSVALIASGLIMTLLPEQGSLTGSWFRPLNEPVRLKPGILAGDQPFFSFEAEPPVFDSVDWYAPLSEPVRIKPSLKAGLQQFLAYSAAATQNAPNNNFAEQTSFDKYGYPWSEPVRIKPAVLAGDQPFFFFEAEPPVFETVDWYFPLSEPVRIKPRLLEGLQQATTTDTSVLPLQQMFPWFTWLSEPVRQKPGLRAWLLQFIAQDTNFIPSTGSLLEGWFSWFSEPVRQKSGVRAWLQQFLAYHPRILPTPNVTGTMAATETNTDAALFAVNVYNPVTPTASNLIANVSVTEVPRIQGGVGSIEVP